MSKGTRIITDEEMDLIANRDEEGLALFKRFEEEEKAAWDEHFEKLSKIKKIYQREKKKLAKLREIK